MWQFFEVASRDHIMSRSFFGIKAINDSKKLILGEGPAGEIMGRCAAKDVCYVLVVRVGPRWERPVTLCKWSANASVLSYGLLAQMLLFLLSDGIDINGWLRLYHLVV